MKTLNKESKIPYPLFLLARGCVLACYYPLKDLLGLSLLYCIVHLPWKVEHLNLRYCLKYTKYIILGPPYAFPIKIRVYCFVGFFLNVWVIGHSMP
jgi:hypothetical protein